MYLIPQPKKLHQGDGIFYYPYTGEITLVADGQADLYCEAVMLQREISLCTGITPGIIKSHKPVGAIVLQINSAFDPEAYSLDIDEKRIWITGGSSAGVFYGIQTLLQIIRQKGLAIPVLSIEDAPDLPVRGFYHDVTRSRIPTMDQLKKLADTCSAYKINQLQLYVEHTYKFREMTEVWRDDTPLTAEDILEFDDYCRKRHIELVPSLASFGHLYKILRTRSYRALGEFENQADRPFSFHERMAHHTLDVTREDSLELVKSMLEEFIPLFHSDKFNFCADETFDLGKGKTRQYAETYGSTNLYMDFVEKLCTLVKSYGKTPMLWGDILLSMPEQIHRLPSDTICLNWDYSIKPSESNVKKMHDTGVRQYLCPGVHGWRHMINRMDAAWDNISSMCNYAHKYKAEGILNTDWGDYGHIHHPDFSFPGLIYGAAMSWNKNLQKENDLNRQISVIAYGDKSGRLMDVIKTLSMQEAFPWDQFVLYVENCYNRGEIIHTIMPVKPEQIDKANQTIRTCIQELCSLMEQVEQSKRSLIIPYIIMGEGQILINQVALISQQQKNADTDYSAINHTDLASSIERWAAEFRKLWQQTSRTSEISQVLDVFFDFADYLRQ